MSQESQANYGPILGDYTGRWCEQVRKEVEAEKAFQEKVDRENMAPVYQLEEVPHVIPTDPFSSPDSQG